MSSDDWDASLQVPEELVSEELVSEELVSEELVSEELVIEEPTGSKVHVAQEPVVQAPVQETKTERIVSTFVSYAEATLNSIRREIGVLSAMDLPTFYKNEKKKLRAGIRTCEGRIASMQILDLERKGRASKLDNFEDRLQLLKAQAQDLDDVYQSDSCADLKADKLDSLRTKLECFGDKVNDFTEKLMQKVASLDSKNETLLEKQALIKSATKKTLKQLNTTSQALKEAHAKEKAAYESSMRELVAFVRDEKPSPDDDVDDSDDDSDDGSGFFRR
jgi:hypothetical protein